MITFGSAFSGIGGFDAALERAGFHCAWQIEINPFGRKVLAKHWPDVPRYEDIRACGAHNLTRVDVICGGWPCQDVSVAGKRAGLEGERTGLFYEFMRLVDELQPDWILGENVPGHLSSHGGRDWHAILAALAERGLRRAYRILDSQHFGVAQRRRRVFLVGCARATGGDPGAVLIESAGVRRNSAAGEEAGQRLAATLRGRAARRGVNVPGRGGEDDENCVAYALTASVRKTGDGHGNAWNTTYVAPDVADTLSVGANQTTGRHAEAVAFNWQQGGATGVRRLTPSECETLQGFDLGWTCLCGVTPYTTASCTCPDTPRYAGLGNAVTVNTVEWIARRLMAEIQRVKKGAA